MAFEPTFRVSLRIKRMREIWELHGEFVTKLECDAASSAPHLRGRLLAAVVIADGWLTDNTLPPNSNLAGWGAKNTEIFAGTGKGLDTMNTMRARIEAAGFTNIHEKLYKVPTGDWAKNKILKEAGRLNLVQFKQGMEGYVMFVLTRYGGWTPEEVQLYLAVVRKELDGRPHVYQFTRRIWAQKPAVAQEVFASQG